MGDSSGKTVKPKFIPDPNRTSPRVYANFAKVRTQGVDFTISFGDVLPPTKEEIEKAKRGEEISIPLQCEVVIPSSMVPSLIEALNLQYEKYDKAINPKKEGNKSVEKNKPKG
ncbi:hypothetical protein KKE78_00445 [Patescibacteria group bacterium]|nr:hypothetical protein [Patescibacteria group bacterium]